MIVGCGFPCEWRNCLRSGGVNILKLLFASVPYVFQGFAPAVHVLLMRTLHIMSIVVSYRASTFLF